MKLRKCSPAALFYGIEAGQLGAVLRQSLETLVKFMMEANRKGVKNGTRMTRISMSMEDESGFESEESGEAGEGGGGGKAADIEGQNDLALMDKFNSPSADAPINLWDVVGLLRVLERLGNWIDSDSEGAAKRIVNTKLALEFHQRVSEIMRPFFAVAEVHSLHGQYFYPRFLSAKQAGALNAVLRSYHEMKKRESGTGFMLSNVAAQRNLSYFSSSEVVDLREERPDSEQEHRFDLLSSSKTLLKNSKDLGMIGLFNDEYVWSGTFQVVADIAQQSTGRKKLKAAKGSGKKKRNKRGAGTRRRRKLFPSQEAPESSSEAPELRDYFTPEQDERLKTILLGLGLGGKLERILVPGDGDCGPTSLSIYLGSSSQMTRFMVARWIKNNPSFRALLDDFPDEEEISKRQVAERMGELYKKAGDSYLRTVCENGTWVDLGFFVAAAQMLENSIVVVSASGGVHVCRAEEDERSEAEVMRDRKTIFIAYNGVTHFDCLIYK
jgi:hypothetical protein